jgi:hypothetical protein
MDWEYEDNWEHENIDWNNEDEDWKMQLERYRKMIAEMLEGKSIRDLDYDSHDEYLFVVHMLSVIARTTKKLEDFTLIELYAIVEELIYRLAVNLGLRPRINKNWECQLLSILELEITLREISKGWNMAGLLEEYLFKEEIWDDIRWDYWEMEDLALLIYLCLKDMCKKK